MLNPMVAHSDAYPKESAFYGVKGEHIGMGG